MPVMKAASSEARNAAARPDVFRTADAPEGMDGEDAAEVLLRVAALHASSASVWSLWMKPVSTTFERMPCGPKSIAMARLAASIAPLETA